MPVDDEGLEGEAPTRNRWTILAVALYGLFSVNVTVTILAVSIHRIGPAEVGLVSKRLGLKKLSDDTNAAREAALKKAGGGLSASDWAFPDWTPGKDFTAADYKK